MQVNKDDSNSPIYSKEQLIEDITMYDWANLRVEIKDSLIKLLTTFIRSELNDVGNQQSRQEMCDCVLIINNLSDDISKYYTAMNLE